MRNIFTIAMKELRQIFISPIAYMVAFMIFVIIGIFFYSSVLAAAYQQYAPTIQSVIGPLTTILLFAAPAITMRSVSEESRSGTLETLLTAPVRDWEVVFGKWLGAFLFLLIILLLTWIYPLMLNQIVSPGIDQGLMLTNYLGIFLMAGAVLAVGVACSSFFSNQIAAFFATLAVLLVFYLIGYPASLMGESTGATIMRYLDMSEHMYRSFFAGTLRLTDLVYFASITVLALTIGSLAVESRRWK